MVPSAQRDGPREGMKILIPDWSCAHVTCGRLRFPPKEKEND